MEEAEQPQRVPRDRGMAWDPLDDGIEPCCGAPIVGDADAAGEQIRDLLALGLDGVTFNIPSGGHILENVEFAGQVVTKALA